MRKKKVTVTVNIEGVLNISFCSQMYFFLMTYRKKGTEKKKCKSDGEEKRSESIVKERRREFLIERVVRRPFVREVAARCGIGSTPSKAHKRWWRS